MSEEVNCIYKDRCIDYPGKCRSCKKNKGRRSYYEPDIPYWPLCYPSQLRIDRDWRYVPAWRQW